MVILVALGLADGDGHGPVEVAEELLEIVGVLAGGVDADMEVDQRILSAQLLEAVAQGQVAGAVLGDGERLGGGLEIGPEERDAVAVSGGVDADADAVEGRGGRHGSHPRRQEGAEYDECREGGRGTPPGILGEAILVMSGRAARCTNTLIPSRREQSPTRGQSLRRLTALPTTPEPVSQTGPNRSYKAALSPDLARTARPVARPGPARPTGRGRRQARSGRSGIGRGVLDSGSPDRAGDSRARGPALLNLDQGVANASAGNWRSRTRTWNSGLLRSGAS